MPPADSNLPLAERRRPTHLKDVVGNPRAKAELRAWAESWQGPAPPARRAAVLSGPAGVGKTSAALALANDFGWTVVEMNASDARNERAINQVAGRASITHTLGETARGGNTRHALILLDEADCLTGRVTEAAPPKPPAALRDFLRDRYGTIEALNAAYGLTPSAKPPPFADWDAVPRSPGNFAWARRPEARRDIDDWRGAEKALDLSDRGGLGAIARLVRTTRQPLVLTVNDERVLTRYSPLFRTAVVRVRFSPISNIEVHRTLELLARAEQIALATGAIEAIVRRARGDLRAAANDLDAISPLPAGPVQLGVLGVRDIGADFAALTEEVLTSPRYYRSVEIQNRLDAPPDDLLPWIEENLAFFAPDAAHRASAFDVLAAADRCLSRARRWRVWSQWSYGGELLTGGVSLAVREHSIPVSGEAMFPQFLGEMGRSRGMRGVRDGIVAKAGARFHLSRAKSRDVYLSFLEEVFAGAARAGPARPRLLELARLATRELELSEDEVGFLARFEPDSRAVREILDRRPVTEPTTAPQSDLAEEAPAPARDARRRQRQLSEFGP